MACSTCTDFMEKVGKVGKQAKMMFWFWLEEQKENMIYVYLCCGCHCVMKMKYGISSNAKQPIPFYKRRST